MTNTFSRLRIAALAAGMALTALSAGPAAATEMKLGMTTWVGYGPLFLAKELGYFKDGGLDVELEIIEESSLYMASMAAGRLQGNASTIDEIMKYRSDDVCFKAVYALDDSNGGDGILAPKDVKDVAGLKGMEVGMNEGSVSQFWFSILLKQAGLTEEDVEITNMTADDAAAAFMADRIPVAITWEPHLTLAKKADKGQVLVNSSETPGLIVDVVALRCDFIEAHPEAVDTLVKGLNKAYDYIQSNQDEAYEIMAKSVGGWLEDPAEFAASAEGVSFYGEERNKEFFAGGDDGEAGKLLALGDEIWGGLGKLQMDVKYDDIVDPSFVNKN